MKFPKDANPKKCTKQFDIKKGIDELSIYQKYLRDKNTTQKNFLSKDIDCASWLAQLLSKLKK